MTENPDEDRRRQYYQLSSQLTQLDNAQLCLLLDDSTLHMGWGRHQTVNIGGTNVFLKRIPVTEAEYKHMFSTKNLYDLPTYYHYGIGSLGTGVFRELVAHVKTTNWVLSGEIANFPLLYHYRIMPFFGEHEEMDMEKHSNYVRRWAGNENIGRYMLDRANAKFELILFLEHIPHMLHAWLTDHPSEIAWVLENLRITIDFLRQKGIIHFDAHFYNALTDGERVYLTDFGLVLDKDFVLQADEKAFFDVHTCFDYGEFISNLIYPIHDQYEALTESAQVQLRATYGMQEKAGDQYFELLALLSDNIEAINASSVLTIDKAYSDCIVKYRSILALMGDFYQALIHNKQKDTEFPDAELGRLLNDTSMIKPDKPRSDHASCGSERDTTRTGCDH